MMGPGIAVTLGLAGLPVTLISRSHEGAARGLERARALAEQLESNELAATDAVAAARGGLTSTTDFETAVRAADFIVESGPENPAWKQDLFARLDRLTASETVLASNTSSLSITAIAAGCLHPERVLTTHYWNPPHLVPLVERGGQTSDEAVEATRAVLVAGGKVPVVVKKDRPGQLGNRLQMALVREAAHIIEEDIAEAADIDAVIQNGLGIRMPAYGTLEHMDIAGLDLAISVLDYVARDLCNEPGAPEVLRGMVARGELGAKTGTGFYDWSARSAAVAKARRDAFLIQVLRWRKGT